jgi:hypothetical protein
MGVDRLLSVTIFGQRRRLDGFCSKTFFSLASALRGSDFLIFWRPTRRFSWKFRGEHSSELRTRRQWTPQIFRFAETEPLYGRFGLAGPIFLAENLSPL